MENGEVCYRMPESDKLTPLSSLTEVSHDELQVKLLTIVTVACCA